MACLNWKKYPIARRSVRCTTACIFTARAMLAQWLFYILRYFDIYSFCTEYQTTKVYARFVQLIFIFHLATATLSSVLITRYINRPMSDNLGKVNDIVKFGGGLIVYWSSIFEMYANRAVQQRFWHRLNDIDRQCCSHRSFILPGYLVKIFFLQTTMIFIFSVNVQKLFYCDFEFLYFFYSFIFIVFVFLNRAFYYLFYVELIKCELETIKCEAKIMVSNHQHSSWKQYRSHCCFEYERFKWIRVYYRCVYGISVHLNETFGWSNGKTILYAFQLTLTDVNWFYWKWYNGFTGPRFGKTNFFFHVVYNVSNWFAKYL